MLEASGWYGSSQTQTGKSPLFQRVGGCSEKTSWQLRPRGWLSKTVFLSFFLSPSESTRFGRETLDSSFIFFLTRRYVFWAPPLLAFRAIYVFPTVPRGRTGNESSISVNTVFSFFFFFFKADESARGDWEGRRFGIVFLRFEMYTTDSSRCGRDASLLSV